MNSQPVRIAPIVITALVTLMVTSMVWVGIGAFCYWTIFREPPWLEVSAECPEAVAVGETFKIKVAVKNRGSRDIKLANLDFYEDLIDGFEVVSIDPIPGSKEKLLGYASYNFYRNLKPSETFEVELELKAKEVGLWGGDIDACTVTQNFVTHYTKIEVVEAADGEAVE